MLEVSSDTRRVFRTEDAANYVGLAAATLAKFRLTGAGPKYIKLGRTVVYHPEDLDAWLTSKRRRSTSVES